MASELHPFLLEEDSHSSELELSKYSQVIRDLTKPKRAIYFTDFVLSAGVGNLLIVLAVGAPSFSISQVIYIFLASVLLFRASVFVHEDFHFARRMKGFRSLYCLLFGFLHKLPPYVYAPHRDHHSVKTYGTRGDPEYDALAEKPAITLLVPVFSIFLFPALLFLRFGILPALLPFVGKKARRWIYVNASTFVMQLQYKRPPPTKKETREWYLQDAGCLLYNTVFLGLMAAQILPWKVLWIWYFVAYGVFLLNYYRAIVSHTYMTGFQPTNYKQQILDSITISGSWIWNEWWCPTGLRYHALHHMYPSVPYHNLGKVHKRLLEVLPTDHPYRRSLRKSYFVAVKSLIKESGFKGTTVPTDSKEKGEANGLPDAIPTRSKDSISV